MYVCIYKERKGYLGEIRCTDVLTLWKHISAVQSRVDTLSTQIAPETTVNPSGRSVTDLKVMSSNMFQSAIYNSTGC